MNKRDAIFALLDTSRPMPYIPAAFFLHFAPEFHEGDAAVRKHTEYFRATGMDLVKIQYERVFPHLSSIQKPTDWAAMPHYGREFYAGQLAAVEGIVKALKHEAVIVLTLYSPFMCAGHTTNDALLTQHLNENPEATRKGLEIITDSLLGFVRECIKLGVDGFYTSTQGGEAGRFQDSGVFERYIKPFDRALMDEINAACAFNILHVCDYQRPYDDFSPFVDYPGHIINAPLHWAGQKIGMADLATRFKRPFMGGLDRLGILATGTPDQVKAEVTAVLKTAPDHFMLGADCTVPANTPWENLKAAIECAHQYRA